MDKATIEDIEAFCDLIGIPKESGTKSCSCQNGDISKCIFLIEDEVF